MTEHAIGEWRIAERYQLGYVAEALPGDERFTGMLSIPYLVTSGGPPAVAAMKYRNLTGKGPKYNAPHGQKPRLYNTGAFFAADSIVGVAEGEIDAIVATERLGVPTFGVPGVETFSKMADIWAPIFKDFLHVIIFGDGDEAGKRLADTVAEAVGWRARVVMCPDGEDVASMVHAGRADEVRQKCQLAEA